MQTQITYTFLIIFCIWFLTLYNRIFDKKLKKYILLIGGTISAGKTSVLEGTTESIKLITIPRKNSLLFQSLDII